VLVVLDRLVAAVAVVVLEAAARAVGVLELLVLEDALAVAGADVAEGDELDGAGVVLADEHAALVAGADDGGLDRLVLQGGHVVAVVRRGADRDGGAGGDQALHEAAARHAVLLVGGGQLADDALEVRLAGRLLFGVDVKGHGSALLGSEIVGVCGWDAGGSGALSRPAAPGRPH